MKEKKIMKWKETAHRAGDSGNWKVGPQNISRGQGSSGTSQAMDTAQRHKRLLSKHMVMTSISGMKIK